MSTIAAVSTPNASGGIGVIRISGEHAVSIAEKIFFPSDKSKSVSEMKGYTAAHGTIKNKNGQAIDDGILTIFKAPKSYTGEDIAEISCHGGIYVTREVLRAAFDVGATPAAPGEFTRRAFLNGKMSLNQAEAVMDIISATGENELRYAEALKDGAAFNRINLIKEKLISVLADLSAWADFPEEDVDEVKPDVLISELSEIYDLMKDAEKTYDFGKILREGISTVIAGKPNVGKSTLMNALSGYQRSIVTDIAGTTRDVIEETINLGDVKLRLCDTAGIRATDDPVESAGVDLARKHIEKSDLIIAVFDMTAPICDEDTSLINSVDKKRSIAVINKTDGLPLLDTQTIEKHFERVVFISAKNGDGIEKLRECVTEMFMGKEAVTAQSGIIANERQRACLIRAMSSVKEAKNCVIADSGMLDAVTVLLDEATEYLMELTGESVSETVVDEVFSKFCVGK